MEFLLLIAIPNNPLQQVGVVESTFKCRIGFFVNWPSDTNLASPVFLRTKIFYESINIMPVGEDRPDVIKSIFRMGSVIKGSA